KASTTCTYSLDPITLQTRNESGQASVLPQCSYSRFRRTLEIVVYAITTRIHSKRLNTISSLELLKNSRLVQQGTMDKHARIKRACRSSLQSQPLQENKVQPGELHARV